MVLMRIAIALAFMIPYAVYRKRDFHIGWKSTAKYAATGILIALHWMTFFEALKISNVSVTLSCLASASLFTAFLEPLFFRRRIILYEVLFGLAVIVGLYMIFSFESKYMMGIIVSVFSAFCAALFTVINGKHAQDGRPLIVSIYELSGGFIAFFIYLAFSGNLNANSFSMSYYDVFYLFLLGSVCTAYAYVQNLELMKDISPYTVSISVNMEPVYSIILALIFFGDEEFMSVGFYFGTLIILSTVLGNAWLKSKKFGIK